MKRILVGVDGTEPAAAALRWACRLAERAHAELILANVVHPKDSELPPGRVDELRRETERHLLDDWSAPLRGSEVTWSTLVLRPETNALLEAADDKDVDLVVIGIHRHGPVASLHMGSLAHHLAHITRRPLAIVPETTADQPVDHIVVGVDGSAGSQAAVRWVAELAAEVEATVLAAYVMEPPAEWLPRSDPQSWTHAAHKKLTEWSTPLQDAGVAFTTELVEEMHPATALADTARDANAGLIVVGTTRVSNVIGLRLGRFPLQLTHHAELPIVLVPPATYQR